MPDIRAVVTALASTIEPPNSPNLTSLKAVIPNAGKRSLITKHRRARAMFFPTVTAQNRVGRQAGDSGKRQQEGQH